MATGDPDSDGKVREVGDLLVEAAHRALQHRALGGGLVELRLQLVAQPPHLGRDGGALPQPLALLAQRLLHRGELARGRRRRGRLRGVGTAREQLLEPYSMGARELNAMREARPGEIRELLTEVCMLIKAVYDRAFDGRRLL